MNLYEWCCDCFYPGKELSQGLSAALSETLSNLENTHIQHEALLTITTQVIRIYIYACVMLTEHRMLHKRT